MGKGQGEGSLEGGDGKTRKRKAPAHSYGFQEIQFQIKAVRQPTDCHSRIFELDAYEAGRRKAMVYRECLWIKSGITPCRMEKIWHHTMRYGKYLASYHAGWRRFGTIPRRMEKIWHHNHGVWRRYGIRRSSTKWLFSRFVRREYGKENGREEAIGKG